MAKLREFPTGDAPILLKINMEAGHGGASGRFDFLKEIALDYAFAVWALEEGWTTGMIVRPATEADAEALAAIYGHAVLHGFGTFEEVAADARRDGGRRTRGRRTRACPIWWPRTDGAVLGFAYAAPVPAARRLSLHAGGQRLCGARTPRARASARAVLSRGASTPARRWACAR